MARGWESKSVESQQELAAERKSSKDRIQLSAEELKREALRDSLLLSRTRVVHDIQTARHDRHKEILRAALAHLDAEIAKLG